MPCIGHLQVLQEIEKEEADRGVTLLAISIDSPDTAPRIPGFLAKHHLKVRVLLAGEQGIPGLDTSHTSGLFIIDRRGGLAGIPSEFPTRTLEKAVRSRVLELASGNPTRGPVLWSFESAPDRFGLRWHVEIKGSAGAVAVAPAAAGHPAEIAILDGAYRLRRFSRDGELLGGGETAVGNWLSGLTGADLDGDGIHEWLLDNGQSLKVLDGDGKPHWTYIAQENSSLQVGGVADLDGDGRKEIVIREQKRVTALRQVPRRLWTYESREPLRGLRVSMEGRVRAQGERGLLRLDSGGKAEPDGPGLGDALYLGEIPDEKGAAVRIFGSPRMGFVQRLGFVDGEHDLDGDGVSDLVISSPGGISAYAQDGRAILNLSIAADPREPKVALADLDGRPGDEMVVFVMNYGLAVFGMRPDEPAGRSGPPENR